MSHLIFYVIIATDNLKSIKKRYFIQLQLEQHEMTIRMSESVFILLATTTLDKLQILTKGDPCSKGPYITFQHSSPLGFDKKFLPRF